MKNVLSFTQAMAQQDTSGNKPHLILIQNFCPLYSLKNVTEDLQVDISTRFFMQTLEKFEDDLQNEQGKKFCFAKTFQETRRKCGS